MRRRLIAVIVLLSFIAPDLALAVDSKGAAYQGGTASTFKDAKDPIEGVLDLGGDAFVFVATEKAFKGQRLSIPWTTIVDLEFGQKAGRRIGTAVATTVLLGPIGLLALFSKKKKHYLTIGYQADGADQVAVLEIGKDIIRTTVPITERRSGKKVEYQDEDARKSVGAAK